MLLFEWNDNYSVNVKEFDNQHKKLIDLINELFEAMKSGRGKIILEKVFLDLIEYTKVHFSAEEKLMNQYDYPDKTVHINAHNELTGKVIELQTEFKNGKIFISIDTMNFLKDWLTKHILGMDKNYSSFFNSKGIK